MKAGTINKFCILSILLLVVLMQKFSVKNSGVLKEIYSMWDALSPLEYEFASAKLTEFFIKAETYLNFEINTQTDYQIWELMDYIDKNITKGITLVSVSEKAGISESSFPSDL